MVLGRRAFGEVKWPAARGRVLLIPLSLQAQPVAYGVVVARFVRVRARAVEPRSSRRWRYRSAGKQRRGASDWLQEALPRGGDATYEVGRFGWRERWSRLSSDRGRCISEWNGNRQPLCMVREREPR
jgi:hypothetical protein